MEQTRISYETAKLAFEKGFEYPYFSLWSPDARYNEGTPQSVLQKWLRDKHKLHIRIDGPFDDVAWVANVFEIGYYSARRNVDGEFFTYEEALEAGLKESLELL